MSDSGATAASWFAEPALALLAAIARLLVDPSSRTYWPYLLVSIAVAAWLWHRERRTGTRLPPHLDVFSSTTWLGRSAMNDYWLVLLNTAVLWSVLSVAVPDGTRLAVDIAATLQALSPGPARTPDTWAPVALAAALFVADDLGRYLLHRLEHEVPALWELHKVHHSAEAMNFVTAERHHPLSMVFYGIGLTGCAAVVNGAFLWAYGEALSPAAVLGANAFWLAGNLLASSLRHSPAWLSFGPRLERWLLSPAQHQIHHSEDPRHFGANVGSTLAIWDRLAGTLVTTTATRVPLTFGLGAETPAYRSLAALYLRPLRRIAPPRRHPA